MAFTRCILFTRFTREQNTTRKGHLVFQKGHQFHWKMTFIVFCVPSLTFFIMNVENKQFQIINTSFLIYFWPTVFWDLLTALQVEGFLHFLF